MTALRPLRPDDAAFLERQGETPEDTGVHSWFGFREPGSVARRIANHDTLSDSGGILAVADDSGAIVGDVSWRHSLNGPPPNGLCWNIGIWLAPECRGRGHGTAAQRLLAAYLFEHTYLERVEAGTEADNVAEQRALERAGFTREGVRRRACFRGGEWRDMVIFSKLRGEP
jgi:aminoglycoside 6'-N-acetyltransferase